MEMYDDLVSVIVPIYKVEKYLRRCIDSILDQTYRKLDIILVDDGSPDTCGMICDLYERKDERIRVIHKVNGGLSSARNAGIDIMRVDYVTFIDSDDFIHEDFISYLLKIIKNKHVKVAQCDNLSGNLSVFPADSEPEKRIKEITWDFHDLYKGRKREFRVVAWGKLYSADLFKCYRFPEGKINEDEDTTFKILYSADRIVISNRKLYYYYCAPESITRTKRKSQNWDWIEIYQDRITYLEDKSELELINITYKELCIRLALKYCGAKMNHYPTEDVDAIITYYDNYYRKIIDWKSISVIEKTALFLFKKYPDLFCLLTNRLHVKNIAKRIRANSCG